MLPTLQNELFQMLIVLPIVLTNELLRGRPAGLNWREIWAVRGVPEELKVVLLLPFGDGVQGTILPRLQSMPRVVIFFQVLSLAPSVLADIVLNVWL